MSRNLVLLQLAFNIVMLVALLALAWRGQRSRERQPHRAPRAVARPAAVRAAQPESAPPPALDDLVEQAEQKELAAEAALRTRFARFRARAAS
jgi:hypothetical protein